MNVAARAGTAKRRARIAAFALIVGPAFAGAADAADATISNARTTAAQTATADGISTGDITVTAAGSVTTTAGPSVTLNSDNDLTNAGTIKASGTTNAVAVLIQGGFSGSLTSTGTITALNVDSDGIALGSGNIALWVSGSGDFIGNITLDTDSTTSAGGDNAFAVAIDTSIVGDIAIDGTVTAHGAAATAIAVNGVVDGDFTITSNGVITTTGEGAHGILLAAPITGSFGFAGALTVSAYETGFDFTDATVYPTAEYAIGIGASVTGGVQLKAAGSVLGTNTENGVWISPALAASPSSITLGMVDATDLPYGFINSGSLAATIALSDQTVRALAIEGTSSTPVFIEGGIMNSGNLGASRSVDGSTTAISIGDNVQTPLLLNSGTIASTAGATTGVESATAYGVLIAASANLPELQNTGTMSFGAAGDDAYAYGVIDLSGTLLTVTNSGSMTAAVSSTADVSDPGDDDVDGDVGDGYTEVVILDLSQAIAGATVTNSGEIAGETRLGDHNDVVNLIDDGDDDDGTTSVWTGAIDFRGGDDVFTISGAGVFTGAITKADGTLALSVVDGTLALGRDDVVTATTADFSSAAILTIQLSPDNATTPRLDIAERATFADGSKIKVTLSDFVTDDFEAILVRAPLIEATLTGTDVVVENIPYLYSGSASLVDDAVDEIRLMLDIKTPSELGLNTRQTSFYDAFMDALALTDSDLAAPILALVDQADFMDAFDGLMPDTAQATLRANLALADAVDKAVAERTLVMMKGNKKFDGLNGWWSGASRGNAVDADDFGKGIDGTVTAVTFGAEGTLTHWGVVGAALTFAASTMEQSDGEATRNRLDTTHGVVYAAFAAGPVYISGQAGRGLVSNRSDRNFKTAAYDYDTEDEWDATVTTASAEAGLNVAYGGFSLRPSASMSWLSLSEDAHAEDSGLVGFDLAYDALDVDVTRAKAGLALAFTKGDPHGSFTQELRLGWSELIDTTDSQVSGLFVDGSVPFLLDTTPLARTELSAGFGLSVLTEGAMAGISYDATMGDGELSHGAKLQISVNF